MDDPFLYQGLCCKDSKPSSSKHCLRLNQQDLFHKNEFKCILAKQLIAMISIESKPLVLLSHLIYIVTGIKRYVGIQICLRQGYNNVTIFKLKF